MNDKEITGCGKKNHPMRLRKWKIVDPLHIFGHFLLFLSRNRVYMLSNVKNNHSIKFLGSELYGKMCYFVSVCCLLQMLWHFLVIFRFFGFRSGAAKGYKWSLWDIISTWYLADSENRHFKDFKKSGGIKKAGGCAWTPISI